MVFSGIMFCDIFIGLKVVLNLNMEIGMLNFGVNHIFQNKKRYMIQICCF